jgi:GAF domain-containing protein
MKKRSKAGARPAKARPRKALKRKGRNVPKPHHGSSPAGELTRLTRELNDSLKRETATADVLKVISRSTFDLQTVLETLVESAARLCAANRAVINQRDGEVYRVAAKYGFSREYAEYAASHPVAIDRGSMTGRAALEGRSIHVPDVLADPEYRQDGYQAFGFRTALAVPLLREGATIGVFVLTRNEVNPFTDKQIDLVTTFGDQAVIAIENARLLNELRDSLQQQMATSEVLQVISASPGDVKPVFDTMLEKAARVCDANFGNIYRWDGDALHLAATHNTPQAFAEARRRSPLRPDPNLPLGRVIANKTVIHVADAKAEEAFARQRHPAFVAAVELGGARTFLFVPMLKEGELIGLFALYRQEVRPFTDKQIALVTNFAAQAVIAIENARLLTELRQRTNDLTEALQQQTATSEVLHTISSSPAILNPCSLPCWRKQFTSATPNSATSIAGMAMRCK